MNTNLKSTSIPQGHQTRSDNDSVGRGKAQTFHVQTGVRAGGFLRNLFASIQDIAEGMTGDQRAEFYDEML